MTKVNKILDWLFVGLPIIVIIIAIENWWNQVPFTFGMLVIVIAYCIEFIFKTIRSIQIRIGSEKGIINGQARTTRI